MTNGYTTIRVSRPVYSKLAEQTRKTETFDQSLARILGAKQ